MLDYELLQKELQNLHPRTKLFDLLKSELSRQGYWKNKPRGKPMDAEHMRKILEKKS